MVRLIVLLFILIFSCERRDFPECNCGVVLEMTTGINGTNPFPTDCDGIYDNFDNYNLRVRNNCTNNIKVFCNHNPWYHTANVGEEWCDSTSVDGW